MPLRPGTVVLVVALNRRGEIESEIRPGVYRVRLGGLSTVARGDELREVTEKPSRRSRAPEPVVELESAQDDRGDLSSLDLHGLTVDEARNRVAGHISRAILAGLDRIEIIHGIGTGKLKAAITADLRQVPAVRKVSPHPTNPGVLIVQF
jgi:DNA mismatch repair protein MutS2